MEMTLNEAVAMAYKLSDDDPNNPRFDSSLALSLGNSVYREVSRDCLVYPVTGTITTSTTIREYSYPSGIDVIERAEWLPSGGTIGNKLTPTRFNRIRAAQGPPESYYLRGILFGADPLPDDAYTINVWGYGVPAADIAGSATLSYVPTAWQEVVAYGLTARFMEIDQGINSAEYLKWGNDDPLQGPLGIFPRRKLKLRRFLHGGNSADHKPGVK